MGSTYKEAVSLQIGAESILAEADCVGLDSIVRGHRHYWLTSTELIVGMEDAGILSSREYAVRIPFSLFSEVSISEGIGGLTRKVSLRWRKDVSDIVAQADLAGHPFPLGLGGKLSLSISSDKAVTAETMRKILKEGIERTHESVGTDQSIGRVSLLLADQHSEDPGATHGTGADFVEKPVTSVREGSIGLVILLAFVGCVFLVTLIALSTDSSDTSFTSFEKEQWEACIERGGDGQTLTGAVRRCGRPPP
jgi:hypothetical protein